MFCTRIISIEAPQGNTSPDFVSMCNHLPGDGIHESSMPHNIPNYSVRLYSIKNEWFLNEVKVIIVRWKTFASHTIDKKMR